MPRLSQLSRSIAGRAAIVTGAASGMGRATAHLFADEGAHVAVTDRTTEGVDAVVGEILAAGGSAHGWAMDVTDGARVAEVVAAAAARFGRLDIVVNNAGLALLTAIDAPDFESVWSTSLDILLTAHTRVIRAALPHLRRSDAGRIVNISSTEGLGATRFGSPYTAAKHGVIGLTRALAVELGREGITVNCVCPGPIRTGITDAIPEEAKREFARRRTVLGRYGEPEEVAHATLGLVLPAASYITGAHLVVDGGVTIRNA
jgi:3-oxoacyl-[acyl-carrier protein] reductase